MPNVPFSFCHFLQFLSHLFLLSTTCCCSISVVYGFNHHPIGSGRAAMTIRRTNGGSHGQILPSQYNDGEPPLSTSFRSCRSNAELFVTKPRTRSFHSNDEVCSTNKWDDRRAVGLFPSKQSSGVSRKRSVMLQMTASDGGAENHVSNTKESGNKNPLVALWIQMRKLVAKLWTILFLQPLRWIQSLFKNDIGSTDVEVEGKDDGAIGSSSPSPPSAENNAQTISTEKEMEQRHEDVVLTEIENLAADESFDESSPVEVAPTETSPTSPTSETIALTPPPTAIPPSSQSRRATSAVDLTGNWTLLVDDAFQSQYDEYLRQLGQPLLVRTVASTVIGSTREETRQMDGGRKLYIKGSNVRGSWERTLETSEATTTSNANTTPSSSSTRKRDHAVEGHVLKPMITADDEEVEVASWWEEGGTVHKSWVVGGKKYGGGDFENRRYLTDNGNILVCESTFHPNEEGREKARVTWRFLREGAVYGDAAVEFPNIFDVFGSDEEKKKKKKKKQEEEEGDSDASSLSSSEPRMIVGDILDGATTSEEADQLENTSKLDVRAEIERESWVPPSGERWAIAAPGVDLSGKWKLIITEKFKQDYDEFLKSLGQPLIVRGAAVVLIGNTREETKQTDGGRTLYIKGINAKGIWERTLTSSGSDNDTTLTPNADGSYDHVSVPIVTADSEHVLAQSWWENDGTVHVSRTLGVKKYGGGSFESRRYLDPTNGDVYICDSTFHPNDTLEGRERSHLRWKFIREGKSYYVGE